MPELPEVETVRRTLEPMWVGKKVEAVVVRRAGVVHGRRKAEDLLRGRKVARIERLGKQLAVVGEAEKGGSGAERCFCVHLGMTGSLCYQEAERAETGGRRRGAAGKHDHVVWRLEGGGSVVFADPRRFGGVWTFGSMEKLWETRWGKLGADGLTITAGQLHEKLKRTGRAVKAALLDQTVVAGLGNIYVDELLFACGVWPGRRAQTLGMGEVRAMVRRMRVLLGQAIEARGSSTRDYVDGRGRSGGFQLRHRVYGRAGLACVGCAGELSSGVVAGRTTVWCPACQGVVGKAR